MSEIADVIGDENYDVKGHAVIVTITMPFFDERTWGKFCEVYGSLLSNAARAGGEQMGKPLGRGGSQLSIVSAHKGQEGSSVSFYASVKPLDQATEEASRLYGISERAGVLE